MNHYDKARAAIVVAAFLLAWVVGFYLEAHYIDEPWLMGGADCVTSVVGGEVMYSCFGYPPGGLMVLVFTMLLATSPLLVLVNKLESHNPPK